MKESVQKRHGQQQAIVDLSEQALDGRELAVLLQDAVEAVTRELDCPFAAIMELGHQNTDLTWRASAGWPPQYTGLSPRGPVDDDASEHADPLILETLGITHGISAPISGAGGLPFGLFTAHTDRAGGFGEVDLDFLQLTAGVVAGAVARAQTEEQLRVLSVTDPLTGMANRAALEANVRAVSGRDPAALLFVDLDRFGLLLETHGPEAGDEVLREVSRRISSLLDRNGELARFGADEFCVLLRGPFSEGAPADLAGRIQSALAESFSGEQGPIFLTASIGIAQAEPHSERSSLLLQDVQSAAQLAKARGRARVEAFDRALNIRVRRRFEIELHLRQAVAMGQLRLHYQPTLNLQTGQPDGVEALLRWEHPQWGLLGPGEFIPVAEESGLIGELGRWALMEGCRTAAEWSRIHPARRLSMAVNLSSVQMDSGEVAREVEEALAGTGLDPGLLTLEVTESVAMRDADAAVSQLQELKSLGVSLSLDDFGTGYSSLSYLSRFPVSTLKLDRSFVSSLGEKHEARVIAQAIGDLAHALGMEALAEGIETGAQLDTLKGLGYDRGQGYLFARPLERSVLEPWMEAQQSRVENGASEPSGRFELPTC